MRSNATLSSSLPSNDFPFTFCPISWIIRGSHNGIARVADRFKSGFDENRRENGVSCRSKPRLFEPWTLILVSKKKLQSVGVNLDPTNDGPSKFQRLKRGLLKKRYMY